MRRFDPYRPIIGDPAVFLKNESAFMPPQNFYRIEDNFLKRQAAIHRLVENKKTTSDVFVPYLAMCYFDLCLPHHGSLLMRDNMSDEIEFLAKTCLSLAQTVRKSGVEKLKTPLVRKTLSVGERLVVDILAEKLAVVSPLAFAQYHSLCFHEDLPLAATVIIVETQDDARFSFFRPSVVSAAAVLVTMFDMNKANMARLGTLLNSFGGIDRDHLRECFILVAQMCKRKNLRPHAKVAHFREKGLWMVEPLEEAREGSISTGLFHYLSAGFYANLNVSHACQ
uniref:Cyclin C-terminal domain-containing protein n=1 Tax=Brassica campestris TaxID=3711 RepID=A0A3P6A2G8_BRACM|nr:unnamed protein product [Brassica rapa]